MNFDQHSTFYLIPEKVMDELVQAIRDIRNIQEKLIASGNKEMLGDYICEEEAMKLLNRGKTWFWSKRKSSELPGKKAAGRWYYRKIDIQKLISDE